MSNLAYHLQNRIKELEQAIRNHKDSWLKGDDKCWKDNEQLYRVLPEGYTPPQRDTLVEIENCKKYIESCHAPHVTYTSPQKRIEELELVVKRLTGWLTEIMDGNEDEDKALDKARTVNLIAILHEAITVLG